MSCPTYERVGPTEIFTDSKCLKSQLVIVLIYIAPESQRQFSGGRRALPLEGGEGDAARLSLGNLAHARTASRSDVRAIFNRTQVVDNGLDEKQFSVAGCLLNCQPIVQLSIP